MLSVTESNWSLRAPGYEFQPFSHCCYNEILRVKAKIIPRGRLKLDEETFLSASKYGCGQHRTGVISPLAFACFYFLTSSGYVDVAYPLLKERGLVRRNTSLYLTPT